MKRPSASDRDLNSRSQSYLNSNSETKSAHVLFLRLKSISLRTGFKLYSLMLLPVKFFDEFGLNSNSSVRKSENKCTGRPISGSNNTRNYKIGIHTRTGIF